MRSGNGRECERERNKRICIIAKIVLRLFFECGKKSFSICGPKRRFYRQVKLFFSRQHKFIDLLMRNRHIAQRAREKRRMSGVRLNRTCAVAYIAIALVLVNVQKYIFFCRQKSPTAFHTQFPHIFRDSVAQMFCIFLCCPCLSYYDMSQLKV